MKLFNKKLVIQLLFLKLIIGRPIDYEEGNDESSVRISKLGFLYHQHHGEGKEELTAFNHHWNNNDKDNSNGIFNKFNFIKKYHKHIKKPSFKASLNVKQKLDKNNQYIPEYIPDHYIVLFKKNVGDISISEHMDKVTTMVRISNIKSNGTAKNEIKHIYDVDGFRGYHGKFDKATLKLIKESPEVNQKINLKRFI